MASRVSGSRQRLGTCERGSKEDVLFGRLDSLTDLVVEAKHKNTLGNLVTNRIDLSRIFGAFSRRSGPPQDLNVPLTPEFRNRMLQLCTATFPLQHKPFGAFYPELTEFWSEIREKLLFLLGRRTLASPRRQDPAGEIIEFLLQCSNEHFLDFIEFVFQSYMYGRD